MLLQSVGGLLESAVGLSEQSQSPANIPHSRHFTLSILWDASEKADSQHPSPKFVENLIYPSHVTPACTLMMQN